MKRFQDLHTVDLRRKAAEAAMRQNPGLVPVFPEPSKPDIWVGTRHKFLCSREATLGKFVHCLRKRLGSLKQNDSITLMTTSNIMLPLTQKIGEVYDRFYDRQDLYLYIVFTVESTFGGSNVE